MESIIAKKYAKALMRICNQDTIRQVYVLYAEISTAFNIPKFNTIIHSYVISRESKLALLKSFVSSPMDTSAEKLLELLVKNDRISLLPFVVQELKRIINFQQNTYHANLYSKQELDADSLNNIGQKLGKKLGVVLQVHQVISDSIEGIRLEVVDLGIEIAFLRNKFIQELQDFILKKI